jgi:hypothetical protein
VQRAGAAVFCDSGVIPARAAPAVSEAALENRTHPAWQRIKFDELLAQQLSLRRAYLARRHLGAPAACRLPTRPAP